MRIRLGRAAVIGSVAMNIVCVALLTLIVVRKGGLGWVREQVSELMGGAAVRQNRGDYRANKLSVFEQLPIGPDDTVLLGDSIFGLGEWHELLGDDHAKNRSISGENTRTLLTRLDPIVAGRPRNVVILCGINSIKQGAAMSDTTREYGQIVERLTRECPLTDVWLVAVLPVNVELYRKWIVVDQEDVHTPVKADVDALNAFIRGLTEGRARVHFVATPAEMTAAGELSADYTLDGLHLNGRGLRLLADRLRGAMSAVAVATQPVR